MKKSSYKAIIERSKDAYWAFIPELEGVSGVGETVQEAKQSMLEGLSLQQELGNLSKQEYIITYHFDVESLLNYFKGILTNAAFERLTGINQMQMSHYATGLKKPRKAQLQKIESALHQLAEELRCIHL
jgi:predicted RNase H-like HicB family nuclease